MVTAERPGFLSAWSYPQFRMLWVSSLFTYIGRWIETIIGAWLVLEITNSPFLVGLLGTFRFVAMLLGPFCGTISDRFNRRKILIAVQLVYAIASFTIMMLFLTLKLEVWHLFAFTLVGGICNTFDFSARFAATGNVVSDRHLVNAVSLLLVAMGITGILGPLIGGNLLEVIGATGCFAFITASFLASFLTLLPVRISSPDRIEGQESIWQNFIGGLRYVKNDRILFSLILLAALANLCIFPYWFTLIPIFARDILNAGVSGFGYLMAAIGLGGIIGSMVAASLPDSANRGKLTIASIVAWPVILIIFALSRSFYLSLTLLVFIGLTQGLAMALIQALLLVRSSEEMRGRVSGARAFAISTLPLGNLFTGAGASFWNAPVMLILNSAFAILLSVLITFWISTSSSFMKTIKPLSADRED